MVRCTETLLMRLFRVFIRAQSEFLFRCYSDPVNRSSVPYRSTAHVASAASASAWSRTQAANRQMGPADGMAAEVLVWSSWELRW